MRCKPLYRGLISKAAHGADALRIAADIDSLVAWYSEDLEDHEPEAIADLARRYDLLVMDQTWTGEAVAAGVLRPLEEVLSHDRCTTLVAGSVGSAAECYRWHRLQYALPFDVSTQVMAYRPDLIDDLPTTWKELTELSKNCPVYTSLFGTNALTTFYSVCLGLGAEPGGEEFIDEWIAIEAIITIGRFPSLRFAELTPAELLKKMAISDEIAAIPLIFGDVTYTRPDPVRKQIRFADPPKVDRDGPIATVFGGTGLSVVKRAVLDESLVDYLSWLMAPENQAGLIPRHEGQPSARGAWLDKGLNESAGHFYRSTLISAERAWLRPRFAGYLAFEREASAIIRQCLRERGPVSAFVRQLQELWRRYQDRLTADV